jgi:hypothetical protein
MQTLILEAVVEPSHLLQLPKEFPVGCRLRVTVEGIDDLEPEADDLAQRIQTELGRKLLAIREKSIANGLKLQSLETIIDEVRQGRREASDAQDLS